MKKSLKSMKKRKKIGKIIKTILSVIAAISFLLGFLIFVSVLRVNNGEVPKLLGFSVMRVTTGSMEPEFPVGCIVVVRETEDLTEGDVISFYSPDPVLENRVETHRIVEKHSLLSGEREYITKGDANLSDDPFPVIHKRVIGKVVANLGVTSGSLIGILQNPKIIFFLIILPMLVITFSEAVNLVNMVMENKQAKKEQKADEIGEKDKDSD